MTRKLAILIGAAAIAIFSLSSGAVSFWPETQVGLAAETYSSILSLSNAISYQGQLSDNGKPANGIYDFTFRLFDTQPIGTGNVVGHIEVSDHPVTNGLFSVILDFGDVYDGTALWMEISVRPGASIDPHTLLEPRQALVAAPYAHYAIRSGSTSWLNMDDIPAGFADNIDNDVLATLTCSSGQIAEWNGSSWICGTDDPGGGANTWLLSGNSGTNPGVNFLGTSDNQRLQIHVNGQPALVISPDSTSPNLAGGYSGNTIDTGVSGAVISGGGYDLALNQVSADFGAIAGGAANTVDGYAGAVTGGQDNTASGSYAVAGGSANTAGGEYAFIGGGQNNSANGSHSTITGGSLITVTASFGAAGGGANNLVSGTAAAISGGFGNSIYGSYAVIGGGQHNLITSTYGTISGGGPSDPTNPTTTNNIVYDAYGTIGGGGGNIAGSNDGDTGNATYTTISGGENNLASGGYSTIGGGQNNSSSGFGSANAGGINNIAIGDYAFIGGGLLNEASANYASIAGGRNNEASALYSTVPGGFTNSVNTPFGAILGGLNNLVSGPYSSIGGGANNTASGSYAAIPGGQQNQATGNNSFAAGYQANALHDGSFVWSDSTGTITTTAANQFLIDASGGVGIGTNTPNADLSVNGSASFNNTGELIFRSVYSDVGTLENTSAVFSTGPYIYVSSQATNTLTILDITDSSSPIPIGMTTSGLGGPTDIQVVGSRAYVTNDGTGTLQIFDVSDPTTPTSLGSWSFNLRSAQGVYVAGKYAYVASAGSPSTGIYDGLAILDISDPAEITAKDFISTTLDGTSDVYVSGNIAYVTAKDNDRLALFDVSDPNNVIALDYASDSLNAPVAVYVRSKYAYVLGSISNNLAIFDVSNPADIQFISTTTTQLSNPQDMYISGSYAYIAFAGQSINGINSGIAVLDISDPFAVEVLNVINMSDSTPSPERPYAIHGNGRQIFVANYAHGSVSIFDIDHVQAVAIEAGDLSAEHLHVIDDAVIDKNLIVSGGASISGSGLLVEGEFAAIGSNNNYILGPVSFGGVQGTFTNTAAISETYTVHYPTHQVDIQGEARFRINEYNNLLVNNPNPTGGDAAIDFIRNQQLTVVTPTARIHFDATDPISHTTSIIFSTQGADDTLLQPRLVIGSDGDIYPATTNKYDLGTEDNRWQTVYTINGVDQISDSRLKENIADLPVGLDEILALEPVAFSWVSDSEEVHYGLIAQDVAGVLPVIVRGEKASDTTMSISYSELVPVLIQAVQEQQKAIDLQETQISNLEARLANLESKNAEPAGSALRWIGIFALSSGAVILVNRRK